MPLPILVTTLAFGYSDVEDRLLITASDIDQTAVPLLITRRTAQAIVDGLAHVLEVSSATAAKVTSEVRTEIVLMEHQVAVEGVAAAIDPAREKAWTKDEANRLVTRIDVSVLPTEFVIVLHDIGQPVASIHIGRIALHRLIEMVRKKSELVGWNLKFGTPWLNANQAHFTIN